MFNDDLHPLPAAAAPKMERMEFNGNRGRLIGILVGNLFLSIITFGIYRFWARTRLRREFWSMLSFRGEPLVYTGTGLELFVGFLIAMVALIPLFAVMQVTTMLIPPTQFWTLMGVNMVYGLVIGALSVLGMFYARRYLLSRTRWRGIQAGQDGSAKAFMLVHLKAYAIVLLTLGVAQPWADSVTYNYRMGITRFGTGRFSATTGSHGLWGAWLPVIGLFLTGYVLFFVTLAPFIEFAQAAAEASQTGGNAPPKPDFRFWTLGGSLACLYLSLIAYYNYALIQFRNFTAVTRFETMSFRCDLPLRSIMGVALVFPILWAGTLGLSGWIGYSIGKTMPLQVGIGIGLMVAFLVQLLLSSLLTVGWFYMEVLRRVVGHLEITGTDALDDVVNRGQVAPRRGEGMADALGDVGMAI